MKRCLVVAGVAIAAVAIALVFFASRGSAPDRAPASPSAPSAKVITGATLFDGTGRAAVPAAAIVIEHGRITRVGPKAEVAVPAGAEVIDVSGKFVIPGLADMHNHLRSGTSRDWEEPERVLAYLFAWGITSVFTPAIDFESFAQAKQVAAADAGPYPHFFATGPIITGAVNPGNDFGPKTPDEARDVVRRLKEAGVDAVKLFYDDNSWLVEQRVPLLGDDVIAALINEAHQQGLKVFAHSPILSHAKTVLRAGGDGLLHSVVSDPVDDELLGLMKKNGAMYVGTLGLFEDGAGPAAWVQREAAYDELSFLRPKTYEKLLASDMIQSLPAKWTKGPELRAHLPVVRSNLKRVFDAGIPVVIGTDTGLAGVIVGVSLHLELLLNVEAGLAPADVLRAATLNAARMIGHEKDLGSIEPGKLADLLILDADPLADIRNTRRIYRIVRSGALYDPKELLPP